MLNESSMLETCTDEEYAISEDNRSDKEVDKPKTNVPQNLTPVTTDNHGGRHHFLS